MSDLNEKSAAPITNILTIERPAPPQQVSFPNALGHIEDIDSTHTLTPTTSVPQNEKTSPSPFSPFYNPAPTRYSLEAHKSDSNQHVNVISAYETDIETGLIPQKTTASGSSAGLLKTKSRDPNCTVWPGRHAMKMKKKAMRKERSKHSVCGCMSGLDKRTKIWVKVGLALLVIGLVVAVGVGVSRAVGGGIWKGSHSSNSPISSR